MVALLHLGKYQFIIVMPCAPSMEALLHLWKYQFITVVSCAPSMVALLHLWKYQFIMVAATAVAIIYSISQQESFIAQLISNFITAKKGEVSKYFDLMIDDFPLRP